MNRKKESGSFVNIGSSSLLVVFLVLCLITFATLSLSTAQSDYNFSRKLADRRLSYYEACNTAEEVVAAVDEIIADAGNADAAAAMVANEMAGGFASSDGTQIAVGISGNEVTYSVPVGDSQLLKVALVLSETGSDYTVTTWQLAPAASWDGDNSITLISLD